MHHATRIIMAAIDSVSQTLVYLLHAEATGSCTPMAVKLIDAVSGRAPLVPVKTILELRDPVIDWIPYYHCYRSLL